VNEVNVTQSPSEHPVNYDAGADLLHKYQTEWNQLHLLAEDNAHKAEVWHIIYIKTKKKLLIKIQIFC